MIAEVISIGNELLNGTTVNTNASHICEQLTFHGHQSKWITTVGDDLEDIVQSLKQAQSRSGMAIMTGGLGPTHDDITKQAVASFFEVQLIHNDKVEKHIRKIFESRNIEMSDTNLMQAQIPDTAEILPNRFGTAPGLHIYRDDFHVFVMPGVPREMKMMLPQILKILKPYSDNTRHFMKEYHTANVAESTLSQKLIDFDETFPGLQLAYLPKLVGTTLRISAFSQKPSETEKQVQLAEEYLQEHAGEFIYGKDEDTLESVVGKLFIQQNKTLAVAESCTGGLISNTLTNVSGSSQYFMRGIVAYSNETKIELLDVPEEIINTYGAVSHQTAEAMAKGVRQKSATDIGVSVTGIAGPGGGTPEKPVGTVFIGYADGKTTEVTKHIFFRERLINKTRTAIAAMDMIRRHLMANL